MKYPLLLPLLLLGTVAALHLDNDAPYVENPKTQADLGQDGNVSGELEREPALSGEVIQTEGEEVEASGYQNAFEDEEAMESDPDDLSEDLICPKEEDTMPLQGVTGCKTCRYLLVRTPKKFHKAQKVCRRCYRGNLVSIHSYSFNHRVHCWASQVNQPQVWIGGILKGSCLCKRFRWTDGSRWNFGFWAAGQPGNGRGHCVALCTKGGRWRRAPCKRRLPFICSY